MFNIGWFKRIKDNASSQVAKGKNPAELKIGTEDEHDYKNIDALVYSMTKNLISEVHQNRSDLVCILGRRLLTDAILGVYSNYANPTERRAFQDIQQNYTVGGLPVLTVPDFPEKAIMITYLKNLVHYVQLGTQRRQIENQPHRNRIVDFNSSNEAYSISDYKAVAIVNSDSIKFYDTEKKTWIG